MGSENVFYKQIILEGESSNEKPISHSSIKL